jgi:fructose/tagatose bisphosphate aldolase
LIEADEIRPCSYLVFHGGSGSTKDEIKTAVTNGVVKMNVDTDTQFAYLAGIRDFIQNKSGYLQTQVGNPEGDDKPNKKVSAYYLSESHSYGMTIVLRPSCLGS